MKITLNGKIEEVPPVQNLEAFVATKFEKADGVIAELNEIIIRRHEWKSTPIKDGDSVELIQFVGGG